MKAPSIRSPRKAKGHGGERREEILDAALSLFSEKGVHAVSTTGRGILGSTAGRGVKVQLELGGKNPLVVTGRARVDVAVDCAMQGGFGSTGRK